MDNVLNYKISVGTILTAGIAVGGAIYYYNANNNKSNGAMNDLSIITRAIENMQAHFDARLDRIEGMLMQHSMRLNRIENMKSGK